MPLSHFPVPVKSSNGSLYVSSYRCRPRHKISGSPIRIHAVPSDKQPSLSLLSDLSSRYITVPSAVGVDTSIMSSSERLGISLHIPRFLPLPKSLSIISFIKTPLGDSEAVVYQLSVLSSFVKVKPMRIAPNTTTVTPVMIHEVLLRPLSCNFPTTVL